MSGARGDLWYTFPVTIAVFEEEAVDRGGFRAAFPEAKILFLPEPLRRENAAVAEHAEVISVFVKSEVREPVLKELPSLKFIATRSTGADHIDLAACAKRGIVVSNVPSYGENSVAEFTFALILALARKIFQSYERTERFRFNREGLQGFDLLGKTLGVIGVGRIGRFVVKIGNGFGMRVIAYDPRPNPALEKELRFRYVRTLDELLGQSDIITLHLPLTPETRHLINRGNIQKAKRSALLINTSRGGIIETGALVWALDQGILSGAGLDVLEEENAAYEEDKLLVKDPQKGLDLMTLLRNHLLVARDDVIVTPHNAFNTREGIQRIIDQTVENIQAYCSSGTPINVVGSSQERA